MRSIKIKPTKKHKLKFKKIVPERYNLCKLSVYVNALYFLGFKQRGLTPEKLLKYINDQRISQGKKPLNPDDDVVPNSDLKYFLSKTKLGNSKILYGKKYLNLKLWKKLLDNKFLVSSDHQELYFLSNFDEITLEHLPKSLLDKLIKYKKFNYKKFVQLYKYLIKIFGPIDEGHVDIVVGVINSKNPEIVLANLNADDNKNHIRLPWFFYSNYMTLDWERSIYMKDIKELPPQKEFEQLRENGKAKRGKFSFIYGMIEVFYKKEQEKLLREILSEYE